MNKKRVWLFFGSILVFSFFFSGGCGVSPDKKPAAVMQPVPQAVEIPPEPEIRFIAVGDINLARKVDRLMSAYGMDYPFKGLNGRLKEADFTFGNLECAVSDRGSPLPGKGIWLRARPEVMGELNNCGFDILSVANNHSLDYDTEAFLDTLNYINRSGILSVGGGVDIMEARQPRIVESNGLTMGFLAYTEMADMIWSYQYPRKLKATDTIPGLAPFEYESILQDVRNLNRYVDFVVLSLHWGTEYAHSPSSLQVEQAHGLVDAGADIIIGHHPHVIQGVEVYNQGLIAYSLGNFIFDQNWSDETREGLVLELCLKDSGLEGAKLLPVIIIESQPKFEQTEWARRVAGKVREYSADLGTYCEIKENPLEVIICRPEYHVR